MSDAAMNTALTVIQMLAGWPLVSLGLWLVSGKMRWKRRWQAWIPGLRFAALGDALEMDLEGIAVGVSEVLVYISTLLPSGLLGERWTLVLSLFILAVIVFRTIYSIRLFLRLADLFGMSRWWLVGWLLVRSVPLLILGTGKKYQPKENRLSGEDWKAGTVPADLPAAAASVGGDGDSGLRIALRERTVRDFARKRYLLKDISLSIPNGSLVLLLGGSGAGKTTFVNAVIGYEKADAQVRLNGRDIYRDYDQVKYRIGFVPQKNLIRMNDTVHHTIADAARLRMPADAGAPARNERITEVMDLLGLSSRGEGLVGKKSGGMQRRISIAMELVSSPELFILDEPDSGLDGVIAREIFTRLRAIADEGRIVMVITHTPDRVIDLFDKVIVLARDSGRVGRLAFYGSPEEARRFFERDTMEEIVMRVNRKEEGGEGLADEFIRRYSERTAEAVKEGAAI